MELALVLVVVAMGATAAYFAKQSDVRSDLAIPGIGLITLLMILMLLSSSF